MQLNAKVPQPLRLGKGRRMRPTHKTGETLESSRDSDSGVDFDQYAFGGLYVDLQSTSFVQGRVEQCKETLGGRLASVKLH